ncbi:hypothetical protein [Serratia sp. 2723]|uniref:hypothetical protein n=1 Tax=unclassified Serratia (in: enterobacteria) TaxID=2647522 RepID=UPI003D1E9775
MKGHANKILLPLIFGTMLSACQLEEKEAKVTSVYTPLSGATCQQRTLEAETGSTAELCPGVAKYQLDSLYDDNRMSLTVITPDQKNHPLNLWDLLPSGSSSLVGSAEWRMKKEMPIAFIVRFNTSDQSDLDNPVTLPHLLVSKITSSQICVIEIIDASQKEAEKIAANMADNAVNKPCLPVRQQ